MVRQHERMKLVEEFKFEPDFNAWTLGPIAALLVAVIIFFGRW